MSAGLAGWWLGISDPFFRLFILGGPDQTHARWFELKSQKVPDTAWNTTGWMTRRPRIELSMAGVGVSM